MLTAMPAVSNTLNASNLAAFATLLAAVKEFGSRYNPASPRLSISSLDATYERAQRATSEVLQLEVAYSEAIDERINLFGKLYPYASQVVSMYSICSPDERAVENARMILRRLRGARYGAKQSLPEAPDADRARLRSHSQLGFEDRTSNFAQLVSHIEACPLYKVNEPNLTKEAVRGFADSLTAANDRCIEAAAVLQSARIRRDDLFYDGDESLHQLFMEIKKYLRGAFGVSSVEMKRVSSILFRRLRRLHS